LCVVILNIVILKWFTCRFKEPFLACRAASTSSIAVLRRSAEVAITLGGGSGSRPIIARAAALKCLYVFWEDVNLSMNM